MRDAVPRLVLPLDVRRPDQLTALIDGNRLTHLSAQRAQITDHPRRSTATGRHARHALAAATTPGHSHHGHNTWHQQPAHQQTTRSSRSRRSRGVTGLYSRYRCPSPAPTFRTRRVSSNWRGWGGEGRKVSESPPEREPFTPERHVAPFTPHSLPHLGEAWGERRHLPNPRRDVPGALVQAKDDMEPGSFRLRIGDEVTILTIGDLPNRARALSGSLERPSPRPLVPVLDLRTCRRRVAMLMVQSTRDQPRRSNRSRAG